MSARLPVVFVSHGSPDALLNAPDAVACWQDIGQSLPQPAAILVVSAHWEARLPTASMAGAPATIHDFSGFAPALYRMRYPAPGAPALAERVVARLAAAGIAADLHPDRGLDHGAWVPLSAMVPRADVPVAQLSLVRGADAATHLALGRALAPLREEGVLILASGAITHNFDWLDRATGPDAAPLPSATEFADWVAGRWLAQDLTVLADYRAAPHGAEAHPTEEHLLPLFVALGAADGDMPRRYRPRFAYRGLAMDAYVTAAGQDSPAGRPRSPAGAGRAG
jgi:4,5-DOPA dioxygenase extradiol